MGLEGDGLRAVAGSLRPCWLQFAAGGLSRDLMALMACLERSGSPCHFENRGDNQGKFRGDPVIGFRPKPSALFLERPRLLRLLPEEAGYVVWLEAPYGYGKSVLTAQWASKLELDGWRVIWLALLEGDPRLALTAALALPETASWTVLLTALASTKTVVIFEDFENRIEVLNAIGPLLKHNPGLLLLASRQALSTPELLRARAEGRLIHLGSNHLAFTVDEAIQLFGDRDPRDAWDRTRGWSLPLHLAALTGDVPNEPSFWAGVRASLDLQEWRTLLTLCSLEFAPFELFPLAQRLACVGLIQVLEGGHRVHPMISGGVLQTYRDEARAALLGFAPQLPPLLCGQALANLGLLEALNELLESNPFDFARFNPEQVLRWDAMLPLPRGKNRSQQVGKSLCRVGQIDQGVTLLLESAQQDISPDALLSGYKDAVFFLAQQGHLEQAQQLEHEGLRWLDAASAEMAGRFLHNCYTIYYGNGDWTRAEASLLRALTYYPEFSPWRTISAGNLAIVRWHAHGDLKGLLAGRGLMLETNRTLSHANIPGDCLQLAEVSCFLGDLPAARALLIEAGQYQYANPRWALEAEALLSYLNNDLDNFALLHARVSVWADEQLIARVRFFWARTLRLRGLASFEVASGDTAWERIERALALNDLTELGPVLDPHEPMELRLYDMAARFQIGRNELYLEHLIALTQVREHILPGFIPLATLPRTRAEWGFPYPILEVLTSAWKEAIIPRLDEIPLLEVRVLGGFEVRVLGRPVMLTARPRDILLLLTLRLSRERIAEALWPEADTDKSRNNLHVNLNALRKVVEPWGLPTFILESGLTRANVDLWELDRALAANDMTGVQRLYADLAPEFHLDLIEDTRANLRERTLEAMLEHATNSSDPSAAETALEWLLNHEPSHETALAKLLELLIRSGRRFSAERRYRQFAEHLRNDVGLEPSPEIRRILAV
jgi:DNA-binding SARP family transcriptional activator